jgi:hemerythrin
MPLMQWNEKMSVGVSTFDNEHKKLIDLVNALHDGIQANRTPDVLGKVLDGLISYTATHFKHEEEFFAKSGYPASAEHKKEHDDLTRQVLDIQAKFKGGATGTLSLEVLAFLKKWLIGHIQGSDRKYGPHLNAKGFK